VLTGHTGPVGREEVVFFLPFGRNISGRHELKFRAVAPSGGPTQGPRDAHTALVLIRSPDCSATEGDLVRLRGTNGQG
jgi:hypothetical protein